MLRVIVILAALFSFVAPTFAGAPVPISRSGVRPVHPGCCSPVKDRLPAPQRTVHGGQIK